MNKIKTLAGIAILVSFAFSADTLAVFQPGTPAKSAEVNGNFRLLDSKIGTVQNTVNRKADQSALSALDSKVNGMDPTQSNATITLHTSQIDTLKTSTTTLQSSKAAQSDYEALLARVVSLESAMSGKASSSDLSSLQTTVNGKADASTQTALTTTVSGKADINSVKQWDSLAVLAAAPIGTIIPSMVVPVSGYLPNTNSAWKSCEGGSTTESAYVSVVKFSGIPDVRGRFLRGVDMGVGNDLDSASRTKIGTNWAGSVQDDMLGSHSHTLSEKAALFDGAYNGAMNNLGTGYYVFNGGHGVNGTTSTGGSETRPKNVAVYWYIKVK